MDWQEALKAAVEKKGWTDSELQRRTGIPYSTISNWIQRGKPKGEPSISKAIAIADALGLSLDETFRGPQPIDPAKVDAEVRVMMDRAFREAVEQVLRGLPDRNPSKEKPVRLRAR